MTSFLLAVLIGTLPSFAAGRLALVIGNSSYRNVPALPNTVNDPTDVAASLQRLGFAVDTVIDGTFDDMRRALLRFGRDARNADMAVIYFAGHGMEIGGENWLIPVDAELRSDNDAENEAVSLKSAMLQVSDATSLGLVILDSCRNNPFAARMQRASRSRAVDRGLVRVEPGDNVLVAYAAKDGTTASDGNGRNSPFTAALLNSLETPGLEIRFLLARVRDEVLSATNRQQQPFVYGSLSQQSIYFKPRTEETAAAVAPRLPVPSSEAAQAWAITQNTPSRAVLEEFVRQFGDTPYGSLARARLDELRGSPAAKDIAALSPPRDPSCADRSAGLLDGRPPIPCPATQPPSPAAKDIAALSPPRDPPCVDRSVGLLDGSPPSPCPATQQPPVPSSARNSGPLRSIDADSCTNRDAMGVARVVEIDTQGGPGFGLENFKSNDFLGDHEVVLTFDDGPWPNNTPSVLKALADQCVKATFFPVGQHATSHPDILKQVIAAGHTVGTHTWTHADLPALVKKSGVNAAKDEIEKGASAARLMAGAAIAPFFRFPMLRAPPEMITYLGQRNIAIFSTDINSFDFKISNPDQVIESVMTKLQKTGKGIIMLHDFKKATAAALPRLLDRLKVGGFKVVHVTAKDELKTLAPYDEAILRQTDPLAQLTHPTSTVVRTKSE